MKHCSEWGQMPQTLWGGEGWDNLGLLGVWVGENWGRPSLLFPPPFQQSVLAEEGWKF